MLFDLSTSWKKPIILLDDVFVELDREHKNLFWKMMPAYEQLFMSALSSDEVYSSEESTKRYHVNNGYIHFMRSHRENGR